MEICLAVVKIQQETNDVYQEMPLLVSNHPSWSVSFDVCIDEISTAKVYDCSVGAEVGHANKDGHLTGLFGISFGQHVQIEGPFDGR